jgi:DNA-directed RNA polymerase
MRFKDNVEQMTYLRKASDEGQLEYIYAGLDVLSSTPWMINRGVFDTVLKVWNSGEAIADIPPSETVAEYPMPEKPSLEDPDPQARAAYVLKVKERANKMWKDHAERCKFNYNLEIARSVSSTSVRVIHRLGI